jgi:hypothetical protein
MKCNSLFLLLLFVLLLGVSGCQAPAEKEPDEPVEAASPPVDPEELRQIYSLAFDSLVGPSAQWFATQLIKINDSIVVQVQNKLWPYLYGADSSLFQRLEEEMIVFSKYSDFRKKHPKEWRGIHATENFDSANF